MRDDCSARDAYDDADDADAARAAYWRMALEHCADGALLWGDPLADEVT